MCPCSHRPRVPSPALPAGLPPAWGLSQATVSAPCIETSPESPDPVSLSLLHLLQALPLASRHPWAT